MRQHSLKQTIKNTIMTSRKGKRETPYHLQETVEQFLERGGTVSQCEPLNLQPTSRGKFVGCGREYQ